jgi:uncharacterized protein YhaN
MRSGFIRQTDLPVGQDEALRRRLNALVTTGDESGTGDALAQKLRDLRNKCRHNKTGLLPQAERQRAELEEKLAQHTQLKAQLERIRTSTAALESEMAALVNHRQALEYAAAREGQQRLEKATAAAQEAQNTYTQIHARCQMLPSEDFAVQQLQQLRSLQAQQAALDAEVLPNAPQKPETPAIFQEATPANALQRAKEDKKVYDMLSKPVSPIFLILAAIFTLVGVGLLFVKWYLLLPALALGAGCFALHLHNKKRRLHNLETIAAPYGDLAPEQWVALAQKYSDEMGIYTQQEAAQKAVVTSLEQRRQTLRSNIHNATQGLTMAEAMQKWEGVIAEHSALQTSKNALALAQSRTADLSAAIKTVEAPALPDPLTYSPEETARRITDTAAQLQQLQRQEGQCVGQRETLGAEMALSQQLAAVNSRISRLEDAYNALTLAMETLTTATNELQRRFAPRITSRAQSLFEAMTGGKYDRLQLTPELSVNVAAQEENNLLAARWRSDGTVDQLYLALRLAVAGELTPEAPLVLDDALVRFDDTRHSAAMKLLQEESVTKQVILFTCQHREDAYLANAGIDI